MKQLQTGRFYGQTNKTIHLCGITLTDTEYTHDKVDWHYHENAYFTFILQGNIIEGNKREVYNCSAGSLLFHNSQDPHYNIKPKGFTRGFQIELESGWFDRFSFNPDKLTGSINISNPDIKLLLYKIFMETKIDDADTSLSIQSLLLQTLSQMLPFKKTKSKNIPEWVKNVKEILHDNVSEKLNLEAMSNELNIHPVHLSRDFSKYFYCTIGEYIRKLKIEKSLSLLSNKKISLTEIAYECGFSDQSHFLRCFKKINGIKPSVFRKVLLQ
ncbi:MAG: AraC family transcriptional regulator [bacterium]